MQSYSIYWIKEEFAVHYFYKSDLLYRFLKAYEQDKEREDYALQYEFITNEFDADLILSHLRDNIEVQKRSNAHQLSTDSRCLTLHMRKKQIKFQCQTIHEAENMLFPFLRQVHPYLFVIGNNPVRYGWISPSLLNSKHIAEEVLYSYL
ncbi:MULTISPECIES: sporulation inhibitor of replication protein SirA [unclassified Virgibacillus]|uniref:sporulation inhibitor of replication protein SirA n=1 Tax=unclassified Virgibacillus TaxID=2620237 RepID=UPI0024DE795D|nr:sporulation inhibitor of replication protein SirA [Virgibacillus sp. LDC-1]